jgi:hypothetical protein
MRRSRVISVAFRDARRRHDQPISRIAMIMRLPYLYAIKSSYRLRNAPANPRPILNTCIFLQKQVPVGA